MYTEILITRIDYIKVLVYLLYAKIQRLYLYNDFLLVQMEMVESRACNFFLYPKAIHQFFQYFHYIAVLDMCSEKLHFSKTKKQIEFCKISVKVSVKNEEKRVVLHKLQNGVRFFISQIHSKLTKKHSYLRYSVLKINLVLRCCC